MPQLGYTVELPDQGSLSAAMAWAGLRVAVPNLRAMEQYWSVVC